MREQPLATVPPWESNPHALVSLWDMYNYAAQFVKAMAALQAVEAMMENPPRHDMTADGLREAWDAAKGTVSSLLGFDEELPLKSYGYGVRRIEDHLAHDFGRTSIAWKAKRLRELVGALHLRMQEDMDEMMFFYVGPTEYALITDASRNWAAIIVNFPSAKPDIEEATICLALGRFTACVFHLMRVLEQGLYALARELKIPKGSMPGLYQQGEILGEIDKALEVRRKMPKTPQRQEDLQFYADVAMRIAYFKDGFRNPVAHSAIMYEATEAKTVYEYTRALMTKLATRLAE